MVTSQPLTTTLAAEQAPELLRNDVDSRITKLRPMATPIDQLSRHTTTRPCKSMAVDYYAVATRPALSTVAAAVGVAPGNVILKVADPKVFDPSETVVLPEAVTAAGEQVILYIETVTETALRCITVNVGEGENIAVAVGAKVVRMGRAAGELDVQTAQYEALPEKKQNYCQIFK